MFVAEIGVGTYEISYAEGAFSAKSKEPEGRGFEDGVAALAQIAFMDVQSAAEYMPTVGMIEYYTALKMGVEVEQPSMESEEGVIY